MQSSSEQPLVGEEPDDPNNGCEGDCLFLDLGLFSRQSSKQVPYVLMLWLSRHCFLKSPQLVSVALNADQIV